MMTTGMTLSTTGWCCGSSCDFWSCSWSCCWSCYVFLTPPPKILPLSFCAVRGSALQKRIRDREKESELDERDRKREKEELEEIRQRLLAEGHPDPDAELQRVSHHVALFFNQLFMGDITKSHQLGYIKKKIVNNTKRNYSTH